MPNSMRPGDVLAGRYRLVDLLNQARNGRFWRAWDGVLARHVAIHLIPEDDERAPELMEAARRSATLLDPRLLRVLDADTFDGLCYVVNEWGEGRSLDHLVVDQPLVPRRAAWLVAEVGDMIAHAHKAGIAHGRLVPENVLIDEGGAVKVIGFAVDAALHGLPSGRESTDVVDLAGILYTALTGKWPGISTSAVPGAPHEHGRPLRPRQVRAGVPRVLDTLCEEVLSPYPSPHNHGYTSARAIVEAMEDYVGDLSAVAEAEAARARGANPTLTPQVGSPVEAAADEPTAMMEAVEADPVVEETQAGVPVFYEDIEDAGWRAARGEPVPPPPAFEETPERPLFAPDPPEGRTPRAPLANADISTGNGNYWPWASEGGPPPIVETPGLEHVPGRNWMRIAASLAVGVLLLVAVVYAFNQGRGGTGLLGGDDEPEPSKSAPADAPVTVASADDFDPFGDPPAENPEQAPLVIDGDPATTWQTMTYRQNFGPGGLKPGVGVMLDLGEAVEVTRVTVRLVGAPTSLELLGTTSDSAPTQLDDLELLAQGEATGDSVTLAPADASEARYLVVWLTDVPDLDGFRGEIAEVVVRS